MSGFNHQPFFWPSQAYDPLFGNVVLLLLGDDANGSSTFTDSSQYARTVTAHHNAFEIGSVTPPSNSNTVSVFGNTSIYGGNNGASSELRCSQNLPEFQCEEWCVDLWVNRTIAINHFGFACFDNSGKTFILDSPLNTGTYGLMFAETIPLGVGATTIPIGSWEHIALSCERTGASSSTLRMFANGSLDATIVRPTDLTTMNQTAGDPYSIGRTASGGSAGIPGYMNGYRLTCGHPRWTASFSPPTTIAAYLG